MVVNGFWGIFFLIAGLGLALSQKQVSHRLGGYALILGSVLYLLGISRFAVVLMDREIIVRHFIRRLRMPLATLERASVGVGRAFMGPTQSATLHTTRGEVVVVQMISTFRRSKSKKVEKAVEAINVAIHEEIAAT